MWVSEMIELRLNLYVIQINSEYITYFVLYESFKFYNVISKKKNFNKRKK